MLILSFIIIIVTVAADQLTKWLAVTYLMPIGDYPIVNGVLHLTYAENKGMAFSLLSNHRWVFITVSTVAILVLLVGIIVYRRHLNLPLAVSMALIIGGGIGNMIDRLALGYVVDFINFELINFAIFNAADSFVCIGAAILLLYMIISEVKTVKKNGKTDSNE